MRAPRFEGELSPSAPRRSWASVVTATFQPSPGKINYYGRLEIQEDADPHKHPSQLVLDRDLYRRACEQAPEVFRAFPVAATGPVSKYDLSFRDCDEILKDSESETDPAADQ